MTRSRKVDDDETTTLDISGLDNGLYFVQLIVDGELTETNKLEVIHE